MNILFPRWKSICEPGMKRAFQKLGHTVIDYDREFTHVDLDTDYIRYFAEFINSHCNIDCVFTVNYIPIIAKVCEVHHIPYLSYVTDSPSLPLYSSTLGNSCSHAFLFDRALYEQYFAMHPGHVYHLPLGADTDSYDQIDITEEDHSRYDCDISFVGSFHTERCEYDKIAHKLPAYMRGYVDGLVSAQMNVYGYYLISDSFSDAWAEEFKKYAAWQMLPDYYEDMRAIIADFYIGFKCTKEERINTLQKVSDKYRVDLYTTEDVSMFSDINYKGIADSSSMAPKIYKCSKINLNITARPIKTGIPQRVFDIMAAGGFVISNYQSEIPECFVPDREIVLYDSVPDLLDKIEYYLNHDEERRRIAENGYKKVKEDCTYEMQLNKMLSGYGIFG